MFKWLKNVSCFWNIGILLIFFIDLFFKKSINHGFFLGNLLIFGIIAVLFLYRRNITKIKKKFSWQIIFPLCTIAMILLQFVLSYSTNYSKAIFYLLCAVCFFFFSKRTDIKNIDILNFDFKIICGIGCLSIALITGLQQGVAYRENAAIDKGFMTLWLSLCMCTSIVNILFKKHVLFNGAFFSITFFMNMFLIQSKTAMLALLCSMATLIFFAKKNDRRIILKIAIPIVLAYAICAIYAPEDFLSPSMMIAINKIFGSDIFSVVSDSHNLATYEIRDFIEAYALSKFLESPLLGMGMGVYAAQGGFFDVLECECTYLDLLVEGGLFLCIPVIYILVKIVIDAKKQINQENNLIENYLILAIVIATAICFRWNDFTAPYTFVILGICSYRTTFGKETNR